MLVFYSPESLERLANAQTFFIFMDGTFSVPPHPFKQLYTIRVPIAGTVGCCCVLLRQSDICIGGWNWRSWTLVSNCALGVFFTGQQGLAQDAEEALALHFRMKIQFLGSHTITLSVIQASSTQKPEMP
jgi:hypothetical protein